MLSEVLYNGISEERGANDGQLTSPKIKDPVQHARCRPLWGPSICVPGGMENSTTSERDNCRDDAKEVVDLGENLP